MAIGPELSVVRNEKHPDRALSVTLGAFTLNDIRQLFPMGGDDGRNVRFLPPVMQERWRQPTPHRYVREVAESEHTAVWAIRADAEVAGLASLHVSSVVEGAVSYSVVIAPGQRRKGLAEMATAGIVAVAGIPGMLHTASKKFPKEIGAVIAQVNGRQVGNHAGALPMFENAGFLHAFTSGPSAESPDRWLDYVRLMPGYEAGLVTFSQTELDVAAAKAAEFAVRFMVTLS